MISSRGLMDTLNLLNPEVPAYILYYIIFKKKNFGRVYLQNKWRLYIWFIKLVGTYIIQGF